MSTSLDGNKAWRWCKYGLALVLMYMCIGCEFVAAWCEKMADKLWPGFDSP